jgi:hypothetical protein
MPIEYTPHMTHTWIAGPQTPPMFYNIVVNTCSKCMITLIQFYDRKRPTCDQVLAEKVAERLINEQSSRRRTRQDESA